MTIRTSLAWTFCEQFGQRVLQFAGSVAIARLLTPDEVGVFALAMAVNALISSLREFGIGSYLIREPELSDDKIRTAFGMWLLVAWALAVVVFAIRHWVAGLYDTPGMADVLLVLCLTFILLPFGQPAQSLLTREMRFDLLNHVGLATAAVRVGITVSLAALGWSYMALAWGMVLGTLLRSILLIALRPDHLRLRPGLRCWRQVVSFGGWLTGAQVAGTVTVEGQKFVLGGFLNPAAVALFERAVQLPSMARETLFAPVGRVLFPALSRDIREGRRIGGKIETLVAATTVIIWPAFLVLALLAEPLVVFVFGENWRVAGKILPYLLVSQGILALLPQPEQILMPYGRARRIFVLRAFTVVNGLTFTVIGAMHSLMMFAMLRPLATILTVTVFWLAVRRLMDVTPGRLLRQYARAAVVAGVAAAPAGVAVWLYGAEVPVAQMIYAAGLAPPLWLGAVLVVKHPLAEEFALAARYLRGHAAALLKGPRD